MIDLYTWTTPNGRKPPILLEELGLDYTAHAIDIGNEEQFAPDFLKVSPNNKIPAIVDRDNGVSVFESGAILIYLAEKTASPLLPSAAGPRAKVMEWLMFQMASIGPTFGQLNHFINVAPEQIPYAIKRYADEAKRVLTVMEKKLSATDYLAGDYSIADIAAYPWVVVVAERFEQLGLSADDTANITKWLARVGARPAVIKGMEVLK